MYKQIDSFESACAELEISTALPDVSMLSEKRQKPVIANYKLDVIQEAINKVMGWTADYGDRKQWKYYPWFKWSASSRRFASYDYHCENGDTCVGSRRVFQNSEVAIYFGEQFIDIHNDVLVIPQD